MYWSLLRLALSLVVLTHFVLGCAGAQRVESDDTWPLEYRQFRLYQEAGIRIYATGSSAALDVGTFVAEVEADYVELSGTHPRELLAIAYDEGDSPPAPDYRDNWTEYMAQSVTFRRTLNRSHPVADFRSPQGRPDESAEIRIQREQIMIDLFPLAIEVGRLGPEPLAETEVAAVVLVPTSARRLDAIQALVNLGLKQQKVPWWKRTLMAPILPLLRGKIDEIFGKAIRLSLFEVLVLSQRPPWSQAECQALIAQYSQTIGIGDMPDFSELTPADSQHRVPTTQPD